MRGTRPEAKEQWRKVIGFIWLVAALIALVVVLAIYIPKIREKANNLIHPNTLDYSTTMTDIPKYDGKPYVVLNDNQPSFTDNEKADRTAYESYSPLDKYGRCGPATACLTWELAPTEPRGEIGQIKPTGWHTVRYDDLIADKYLYNRCHLIAFCLAGENANERNLITGTRYLNIEGMLPFETLLAEYVDDHPDSPVLYRVTPVFEGKNLVASGVEMEAYSLDDDGKSVCFHVYCFNVQPGITINYATGASQKSAG